MLASLEHVRTVVCGEQLPDFRFDPHAREPGTVLYVRDDWRRPRAAVRSRVAVTFPARLHLGMLDPTATPRVGSHGYGGGIGVSIDALRSRVTVWPARRAKTRDPILLHYLRLFAELVGGDFDAEVELDPRLLRHAGLGSSAAIGVAVLAALDHLCGAPFTDAELTDIYLLNYVEAAGGRVVHGVTTGVAAATLRGGLVGLGAGNVAVRRIDARGIYATLAIVPRPQRPTTNPTAPTTFRTSLIGQLAAARDRATVLRVCRRCAEQNTRRAASCFGLSSTTARLLEIAERSSVDVFGVTSDGPSVFALSTSWQRALALANAWRASEYPPAHAIVSTVGAALRCT